MNPLSSFIDLEDEDPASKDILDSIGIHYCHEDGFYAEVDKRMLDQDLDTVED